MTMGPDEETHVGPELVAGIEDGVITRTNLQHRVVKGSVTTAIHVIVSTPLAAVATAITARLLKATAYGRVAYLTIAATIAISVTDFGCTYAFTQWGAAAEAKGDRTRTQLLLSSSTGFRVLIQMPLLIVFGLVLLRRDAMWIRETYILSVILTVTAAGANLALSIENRSAALATMAMISNLFVQVAVVIVAWKLRAPAPIWVMRLLVGSVVPLYSIALLDRRYRRAVVRPRLPRGMPAGFWRFAIVIWGAGLVTLLVYSRSEVFVLAYYHRARELGIFALAFGLSQQLTTPVDAMLGPLLPASAALLAAHPDHASRAMMRGLRYSGFLSGAIAAILLPAVYFVVPSIYGGDFAQAKLIFLALGLVSTGQSVSSPVNALLLARRRAKTIFGISGASLIVDGAVAFALIPFIGAWGAAIANACSQVVSGYLFIRAEFKAQESRLRDGVVAARGWMFGVVALGAALVAGQLSPIASPLFKAPLAAIIGALVFLGAIRSTGGLLTADDCSALALALPQRLRPTIDRTSSLVMVRYRPSHRRRLASRSRR